MRSGSKSRTLCLHCAGFAAALFALASASCADKKSEISGKLPVFPVAGQLTMDGQPMPDAQIFFFPVESVPKGASKIRPHATTDEEGNFRVATYGVEDGAPVGEYRVTVSWKGENSTTTGGDTDDRPEKVPARYRNPQTTRLKATVTEGQNTLPAWDLAGVPRQASNSTR